MKYSYNWLQKHIKEKLPAPEELKEKIIFHAFEVESFDQINNDWVYDIKVLPDRAGDTLSHYGMAREIAGLFNFTLKDPEYIAIPNIPLLLPVEVKTDLCRRFIAVRIDGVKVGPSPLWLRTALESIGQRSINNIVDATNYVLHDLGQPTHAYDAKSIDGGIVVRLAHTGETIITLSQETKVLSEDMLVIADYVGALGIAGVKGGKNAEISSSTNSIILEIANFDPTSVRKTARTLNLATDASKRFENNISPVTAQLASRALIELIKEIGGGEVTGINDIYPIASEARIISFKVSDIGRLLGEWVTGRIIGEVFDNYHYKYTFDDGTFTLEIPYWRNDINGPQDIAEEVGRFKGYHIVSALPLPVIQNVDHSEIYKSIIAAKAWLIAKGYKEVMTYSFRKNGEVFVARGVKDKSALRSNISDALKESYEMNKLNTSLLNITNLKIFEIGTVFSKEKEEINVAIMEKGLVKEVSLQVFIEENKIQHSNLEMTKHDTQFKMWSLYPYISRDIAIWISKDEDKLILEKILNDFAKTYCVQAPAIFDQFQKDGRTSLAYKLVFQSYEKTLTENEVEEWMDILTSEIRNVEGLEIR